MTMDEIIRRLTALERRVPDPIGGIAGSPGMSTAFGAASVNYRDRFPAVLTSSFDTSTGYSWSRLILDRSLSSPSVVEINTPQSGEFAFTPDNDETLTVGDRGWLEADPNAGGWLFLRSGGYEGGGAFEYGSDTGSGSSFMDSYTSGSPLTVAEVTLPGAGVYYLWWRASGEMDVTALGSAPAAAARLRGHLSHTGSTLRSGYITPLSYASIGDIVCVSAVDVITYGTNFVGCVTGFDVSGSGGVKVQLLCYHDPGSATVGTGSGRPKLQSGSSGGVTPEVGYFKLAD